MCSRKLLISFLVLIFSVKATADHGRLPTAEHTRQPATESKYTTPSNRTSNAGSAEDMRRLLLNKLVSETDKQLEWPPFPRFWIDRSRANIWLANTSMSLQVPIIGGGAKLSYEYRYGLKTSFIIITSKRSTQDGDHPTERGVHPAPTGEMVLRMSPRNHAVYPNVREGFPMVGLCVFEASMAIERNISGNGGVTIGPVGINQTVQNTDLETVTHSAFSNFFQLDSAISVRTYIEEYCNKVFREKIERQVIEDFSKHVAEALIYNNPKSNCRPEEDESQADYSENGDKSCEQWKKGFMLSFQKMFTPRCELMASGAHRCVNKAREGVGCPMYMDQNTGEFSAQYDPVRFNRKAAGAAIEYPCDSKQGLVCTLISKPDTLFGRVLFEGTARCMKAVTP